MKYAIYTGLILGLVPIQTTILDAISVGGIRPDLVLVAVGLVGFIMGPFEGLLLGFALGFVQDSFSAGQLGLNVVTKGLCGLLSGLTSRYVTNATPATTSAIVLTLSIISGVVVLLSGRGGESVGDAFYRLWALLVPQAVYDALIAAAVYWLIGWRLKQDDAIDAKWSRAGF